MATTTGRIRRQRRDEGVAAWAALLRGQATVVRRLEAHLAAAKGLPLSWYDVLLELEHAPDRRLRMQELGNRAVLSRSRVSRVVDELVTEGLVRREPDPTDRRGSYATLTPAGRARMRRAAPAYVRGIDENFTRHLTQDELAAIHTACLRLAEA
ncbi:MAG: MarR family winged helix-turn-helix transcriptional regulator [Acidimicrobiales bacterium]